jgi:hypothetical protein
MTERGCPIQHLAEDSEITRICYLFIKAKRLQRSGYEDRKSAMLNAADFDDELILALESVWIDYELHVKEKSKHYK